VTTLEDDRDIGVRRFYAYDPFGNRLELVDARRRWLHAQIHDLTAVAKAGRTA